MATSLNLYVKRDGTGNFTSLVAGISGIIASGVASGDLTNLYLYVDSGYYGGSFNITVPNSGTLNVIGSGTWFQPKSTCYISGVYYSQSNFNLTETKIVCTGLLTNAFCVYDDTRVNFNAVNFINPVYGIYNYGEVYFSNSSACGVGSGYFINNDISGYSSISESTIGNFDVGLSGNVSCSSSRLLDNNYGIVSKNDNVFVTKSLFTGASGITISGGTLTIDYSTFDTSGECLWLVDISNVRVNNSILVTEGTYIIDGSNASGIVSGCCFNVGNINPALGISGLNISGNPIFNNPDTFDYRLRLKDTIGSPCIEVRDPKLLASSVELITDQSQLILNDTRGRVPFDAYKDFVYKQGNTLLLSDYEKETKFANVKVNYTLSRYDLYAQAVFSAFDIPLVPAMDGPYKPFPFDWDFKKFNTTKITDENEYIIPRSVLDVATAVSPYVGEWLDDIAFGQLKKQHITPYLYKDLRGVAFDYDISGPDQATMWSIEGRNQILTKLNAYTGEVIDEYPLLIANRATQHIYPSGIIAAGVFGDKYKYLLSSNPNIEFLAESDDGRFKWLSTSLDINKDIRGILAYKNNLYLTLTEYNDTITDRGTIPTPPTNSGVGKLLRYSNNGTFEDYIANYNMDYAPTQMTLDRNNSYPTDITIYEDGSLLIADYLNSSGLYKYRFAYDYALIQSSYDRESRVLLREDYNDVEL